MNGITVKSSAVLGVILGLELAKHLARDLGRPEACECVHGPQRARAWLLRRFSTEGADAILGILGTLGGTCDHSIVGQVGPDLMEAGEVMSDSDCMLIPVEVTTFEGPLGMLQAIAREVEEAEAAGKRPASATIRKGGR